MFIYIFHPRLLSEFIAAHPISKVLPQSSDLSHLQLYLATRNSLLHLWIDLLDGLWRSDPEKRLCSEAEDLARSLFELNPGFVEWSEVDNKLTGRGTYLTMVAALRMGTLGVQVKDLVQNKRSTFKKIKLLLVQALFPSTCGDPEDAEVDRLTASREQLMENAKDFVPDSEATPFEFWDEADIDFLPNQETCPTFSQFDDASKDDQEGVAMGSSVRSVVFQLHSLPALNKNKIYIF